VLIIESSFAHIVSCISRGSIAIVVVTIAVDIESSHLNLQTKGEVCSLCGLQNRKFEPAVLYCQGACGLERIKRNASYYTDRTKQNHWCEPCYDLLKAEEPVLLDDGTKIRKVELQIYKNDALAEEKWVNCDECKSWVHQVCALFNDRMNRSDAKYRCPNCELRKKTNENLSSDTAFITSIPPKRPDSLKSAAELPSCKMTDAIEAGLAVSLEQAYQSRAGELRVSYSAVEKVEGVLSVRVLSDVERKHVVGEKVRLFCRWVGCVWID
jgi:E1A/CREB-binding protein